MTSGTGSRVIVLGGGRVGAAIAIDLAAEPDLSVTVADGSVTTVERLSHRGDLTAIGANLSDSAALRKLLASFDAVVGALPGHMGFSALETIIDAGKPVVDISFFAEDPFRHAEAALRANVTAVVDCGVAPGLSNMILGRESVRMDSVHSFECLVGGLPEQRDPPWEYKAPFSPSDVIEEYTRPARVRRNGRDVTLVALSELESVQFPDVGTLEAFVTDGLRTLLRTMETPTMVEKTLRYPGHAAKIQTLRDAGLLDREPVLVDGVSVKPIDLTSRLLEARWRFAPGERDLTVMRVRVQGTMGGQSVSRQYDLLDRFDDVTGTASMSRTTGYTCAAVVRLLARGEITEVGIIAPEILGRTPHHYRAVIDDLEQRGIRIVESDIPSSHVGARL